VWNASGGVGFFGEGYWFHTYLKSFGLDFSDVTFVAKNTTLEARAGNLPLRDDLTPRELMPKCIYVKPWQGIALNAIGLSGPGGRSAFCKRDVGRRGRNRFSSRSCPLKDGTGTG